MLTKIKQIRKSFLLPSRPPVLHIELNNTCNLNCIMCPREQMTRPVGLMNFSIYKQIINDAANIGIPHIRLFMFGEPLLHPKLIEMIKYAKSKNIPKVDFNTNAQLLTKKLSKQIIESDLDRIIFSVDGIDKKTYEAVRKNGNYETVVQNIKNFMRIRKTKAPQTILQTISMNQTKDNIEKFVNYWQKIVDKVTITQLNSYNGTYENIKTGKRKPCPQLWDRLIILWNGDITVCCEDFNGKLVLGNYKDGIKDLWKSKRLNNMRKLHRKKEFYAICRNCDATYY